MAGGAIVSYGGAYGFMGLFIVKREYRAAGLGRKLWYQRRDTLVGRLKAGAAIGMDGVVAMQSFYHKGGFEIAFRDERYLRIGETFEIDEHISPINEKDHDAILEYDETCFGFSRPQFMLPWLIQPDAKTFQYTDRGSVKGFAVMRKTGNGYKIGPLFADDAEVADALYRACLNAVVGSRVFLDISVANEAALSLVQRYGATYVFECARMYFGDPPGINIENVFGITTFELG